MRHAYNTSPFSQGLIESLAQYNSYIFYRMMLVYMKVTFSREHYVKSAMAADMVNQMVQHTNAGSNLVFTGAIDVQHCADFDLFGFSAYLRRSFSHCLSLLFAAMP
jgi:hypothetical protein